MAVIRLVHGTADQMLAVHQGAVDVEDDEFHRWIIGSNIRDHLARQSFIPEIPQNAWNATVRAPCATQQTRTGPVVFPVST
jgi:hypothetical protein